MTRDEAAEEAWALGSLDSLMRAYARNSEMTSVAVVGNAPLEPDPARAAAIDACDLIVRVNGFALDRPGGSPKVGRRCEAVVFTRGTRATPWLFDRYRERLYLLNEPARLHWESAQIPDWWPGDLGYVPIPNREVTMPLAAALDLPVRTEARWATTGTTAVWLARELFPLARIVLSGFSALRQPYQTSWAHSFGEPCEISPEHDLRNESRLLATWAEEARMDFRS